ncbi:MAG: sensor histidine kinase [Candidatus Brocadiia bacterium]
MSSRPRFARFRGARFKLTLYYTTVQLLFLIVLCWFLYYRTSRSLIKELEKFVKDEARDLMSYVYDHPVEKPLNLVAIRIRFDYESKGERYYELSFRLLDRAGNELASSSLFRDQEIEKISPEVLRQVLQGDTHSQEIQLPDRPSQHLLVTRPYEDPETGNIQYVLQVLAYLEPLDKLEEHFRHNIYSAIPVFLLISWVGGYALARKVLKPVHQITRTARRITSTRLDERLARSRCGDEFDRLAETLNEMIARLERSFAMLRQFAADAAHELRTPLTIMKGEAEIALRGDSSDPQAYRAVLESSIRECDRMIGIITNLLLLSQADAGDLSSHLEPIRIDHLLAELVETFQVLAEEAELDLEAEDFQPAVVQADRSRLQELFVNLLDNACKYTPAGGRVALSCKVEDGECRVAVTDTGVGIPEEEQEKVFDRFYRVDHSRSRQTGGSGLGLSIAQWIARAHGGRIELESTPGVGSTFTVVLPLSRLVSLEAEAASRGEDLDAGAADG